jgi:predicted phosphodiesterase
MKIHYISDLHFDYKEFCEKEKFLKMLNCNDLYIIAGDCYNDYRKTLKLIIELENKKIKGY